MSAQVIEKFLDNLRVKREEALELSCTETFNSSRKLTSTGAIANQDICFSEATAYANLAYQTLRGILGTLRQHNQQAGNRFELYVMSEYDCSEMRLGSCARLEEYFSSCSASELSIISSYLVNGVEYQTIQILIAFIPIYTEMLLVDEHRLDQTITQIESILEERISIRTGSLYYLRKLLEVIFESGNGYMAADYIKKLISNSGQIIYRVMPSTELKANPGPASELPSQGIPGFVSFRFNVFGDIVPESMIGNPHMKCNYTPKPDNASVIQFDDPSKQVKKAGIAVTAAVLAVVVLAWLMSRRSRMPTGLLRK